MPQRGAYINRKKRYVWDEVVRLAKRDLRLQSDRFVVPAALYFFTEGENDNLLTFDGLCHAHGVDPVVAAKKLWDSLSPERQDRVRQIFKTSTPQKGKYQVH